jgi:hypothetical protein
VSELLEVSCENSDMHKQESATMAIYLFMGGFNKSCSSYYDLKRYPATTYGINTRLTFARGNAYNNYPEVIKTALFPEKAPN